MGDKMLSVEKFAELQEECLKLEREEEIRTNSMENWDLKALEKSGKAILKLRISGTRTGLYGKRILTFSSLKGSPLSSNSISSGDIVAIILGSSSTPGIQLPTGVITSSNSMSLSLSLDENASIEDENNENKSAALVKIANDVTYKRLKNALSNLNQPSGSCLRNIFFGVSDVGLPHSSLPLKILDSSGGINFVNNGLNESQRSAVKFALLQKEIGIIHGPPGTGKTTTVVEIITQAAKSGLKILCCAPSNIAVDNLLERLVKNKVKCVRLGHPARVNEELQKYSLDALIDSSDQTQLVRDIRKDIDVALKNPKKNRSEIKELRKECRLREKKALKEIFSKAEVILSTLTSADFESGLLKVVLKTDKTPAFDMLVIDECSQALELSCWIALPQARKAILAGDHCQLPPTVMSKDADSKGFSVTLMERLVKSNPSTVKTLCEQYRMNDLIMNWSSEEFYDSALKSGNETVGKETLANIPGVEKNEDTQFPIIMIDTAGCDYHESSGDGGEENVSKANEGEAALVVEHVKRLIDSGLSVKDIAVITPYNLQVDLIRSQFSAENCPEVKTVDGFQGREKEAVILSLVRSNPKHEVGFLKESRRLNVAATRAKKHLTVVCDSETLSRGDPFLKRFVDYLSNNGHHVSAHGYTVKEVIKPKSTNGVIPSSKVPKKNKQKKPKPFKEPASASLNTTSEKSSLIRSEEKEDQRTGEYRSQVEKFIRTKNENEYNFSPELNSHERMLIHQLIESEFPRLTHESVGEGKARQIVLKKKTLTPPKLEVKKTKHKPQPSILNTKKGNLYEALIEESTISSNSPSNDSVKESTISSNSPSNGTVKESTISSNSPSNDSDGILSEICPLCKKSVPTSNISVHQLRCRKKQNENSKPVKVEKMKKKESLEEDFDKICADFAKMDSICNAESCKVKVFTLGTTCQFCRRRFCFNHGMAEIHGCGKEAKIFARKQVAEEGKVYPGSGKPNKKPDRMKRVQLEKKLEQKISKKSEERKTKKKE